MALPVVSQGMVQEWWLLTGGTAGKAGTAQSLAAAVSLTALMASKLM